MMAGKRKPSPLMGAATAMLDGVSDMIVREDSRFRHSMELALDRIRPDPDQPRKTFDAAEIASLAATMAEQGQLQPILVRRAPDARGQWLIVAGERRWRAAGHNGWTTILAIEHGGDAEVATLIENLQRVDLAVVEEARGLQRLLAQKGWSQARAAQALGKTAPEISSTLRILTLPEALLEQLLATKDAGASRYVLAELARIEPGPARDRLVRAALDGTLTQRMVRAARDPAPTPPAGTPEVASQPGPELGPELEPDWEPRLSDRTIQTFRNRLRGLADRANSLGKRERTALHALRAEIDAILRAQGDG